MFNLIYLSASIFLIGLSAILLPIGGGLTFGLLFISITATVLIITKTESNHYLSIHTFSVSAKKASGYEAIKPDLRLVVLFPIVYFSVFIGILYVSVFWQVLSSTLAVLPLLLLPNELVFRMSILSFIRGDTLYRVKLSIKDQPLSEQFLLVSKEQQDRGFSMDKYVGTDEELLVSPKSLHILTFKGDKHDYR